MWLLLSLWVTLGHPQIETCRTMTARTGHAAEGMGVTQHLGKACGDSTWERSMPGDYPNNRYRFRKKIIANRKQEVTGMFKEQN